MRYTSLLIVTVLLAIAAPLFAQETADICLGGGLVARLRDRGAFASVRERASRVDQTIVEIVSNKDTQHPQVTVKQKNSLWTVYAWDLPVVSVYPAEAQANKMAEKQLADVWAKNLRERLPKATPCSKLPPEQLGYGKKPATAATVTASTKPAGTAAKQVAAKPPATAKPVISTAATTTVPAKPVTLVGNETGALLLIADAIRAAREMNDQDWAERKEATSKDLYSNLLVYLTGQGTPPKVTSATTNTATTTTATKPVTATTTPAAKPQPAAPPKPATTATTTPPKPATTTTAATAPPAPAKPDPSMEKVPQKNRIRAKFAAAKPAYDELVKKDAEAAKPIADLLASSRNAFAAGKFDEAEKQIDQALGALGVTFKE